MENINESKQERRRAHVRAYMREYMRRYRETHREELNAQQRAWRAAHKDIVRERNQRYIARRTEKAVAAALDAAKLNKEG